MKDDPVIQLCIQVGIGAVTAAVLAGCCWCVACAIRDILDQWGKS